LPLPSAQGLRASSDLMAGYFSFDPAFAVSWTGTKKLEGNFTDSVHCSDSAAYQTGCRSNGYDDKSELRTISRAA